MKLTIELNEKDIMAMVTELEAKGCYEVAEAIETAYTTQVAKEVEKKARDDFRKEWPYGRYFKHANGEVEALYWNFKEKKFHNAPLYISNNLKGQPSTLGFIKRRAEYFREIGFEEV